MLVYTKVNCLYLPIMMMCVTKLQHTQSKRNTISRVPPLLNFSLNTSNCMNQLTYSAITLATKITTSEVANPNQTHTNEYMDQLPLVPNSVSPGCRRGHRRHSLNCLKHCPKCNSDRNATQEEEIKKNSS